MRLRIEGRLLLADADGPLGQQTAHDFGPRNRGTADFFDFQSAGDVTQANRVGRIEARGFDHFAR